MLYYIVRYFAFAGQLLFLQLHSLLIARIVFLELYGDIACLFCSAVCGFIVIPFLLLLLVADVAQARPISYSVQQRTGLSPQ